VLLCLNACQQQKPITAKHLNTYKKLQLTRYIPRRRLGGVKVYPVSFLRLALEGGEWSASRPGRILSRGKDPR
jgi:hypothetical protein